MSGQLVFGVAQLEVFFLVLARLAGIFIQAPLLSSRSFPTSAKTALVIWLALLLWFVTPVAARLPTAPAAFVLTLVMEVALGFTIGFISNVLFISLQAAGEIIDTQMGLSVAQALDPIFGAVTSIIGRLIFFFALIIFLTLDGHHLLLSALHQSFRVLPAGQAANFAAPDLVVQMMGLIATLWLTALKLAAPIILLIFLADFTFGIVSRVAPQVNVFMLGFQVKPLLGLLGLLLTLPLISKQIGRLLELTLQEIGKLFIIIAR